LILQKNTEKAAFGDFQTPVALAKICCQTLWTQGQRPRTIIEPQCGLGVFLEAALSAFPTIECGYGFDINENYINKARQRLQSVESKVSLQCQDFFTVDWATQLKEQPRPLLILGNPPWVTNSDLTRLESMNCPQKHNRERWSGIEALTGRSNFDISEWMIRHLIERLPDSEAALAMLCKTAVARRVLAHFWKRGQSFSSVTLRRIDAAKHFKASVDACFFFVQRSRQTADNKTASVFKDINSTEKEQIGYQSGRLIANIQLFEKHRHLRGEGRLKWRSGIKHDCSKVMEFTQKPALESEFLYPLIKSSDMMKNEAKKPSRWLLVTQQKIGEPTKDIAQRAPLTWDYLQEHGALLDARRSVIYKKKPRFAIFGVGHYSFLPWKVAISGFAAKIQFYVFGPVEGRATVFDDTCNFLSFQSQESARFICRLLNSKPARDFYSSLVFWDAKRPMTISLLSQLDLVKLAAQLNQLKDMNELCPEAC
jgi:hypothetical protein